MQLHGNAQVLAGPFNAVVGWLFINFGKNMMLIWLKRTDPEIERAFHELPDRDTEAECPCCGEVWGYMETAIYHGEWVHVFRHRHYKNERRYLRIPAPHGWEPTDYHSLPHQGIR